MQRSGNAKVTRQTAPSASTHRSTSDSGVRRKSDLDADIGAFRQVFAAPQAALLWLLMQPSRCANDTARVVMTVHSEGIVLRCPRCQAVAAWTDTGGDIGQPFIAR